MNTFKKGDKVVLKKASYGRASVEIGETGTVTSAAVPDDKDLIVSFKKQPLTVRESDVELYTELPEKWAVPICYEEVRKWADVNNTFITQNTYYTRHYNNDNNEYFNFPSHHGHIYDNPLPGYTVINIETFRQITNTNMEKEIIGYLLKPEMRNNEKHIFAFCSVDDGEKGEVFNSFNTQGSAVNITSNSSAKKTLQKAGVLDLWFSPVYREIMKKETIEVGSPIRTLYISSEGEIKTEMGRKLAISEVEKFRHGFNPTLMFEGLNIRAECVLVGCAGEGTTVTKDDVNRVIALYYKLNPKR